ncbi:transposase IS204/IS1001/IS1096/IS1165 family protein (plasmid) [Leptolyngbya boryana NIES-2135]|uniref:Transposase IS204/IS1001/IS1096/IS1165 family protein n=1 Tax=Leptolyngbya boryana NIES-2135 TaxID=1973484 RepID=A0A1Z4JS23_LEPBY|nr:ISL3 family transposase [Leptolyngbya boryana]MBD2373090.1 ISL3 family transposase [Leptolyngbya sp. FACHB-238]MBD2397155.1 ISL3 family transposase [Leptolyngbya sp. FACHB-239]MBD2404039.1 ISL3 family transposase [Leptolyngbya sp. FACHB-402]BAY59510.1 transposase IS204/IS1001/IS1096/IS1165 family protein [Leptolyngbya boryana NIES-2135]ULP33329.1 ISL3 family transposase [Leptolyngbya boryana IU 594]
MELLELLPNSEHIQIRNYELDRVQKQVRIDLCSTQIFAPCPICQHEAVRVHSRYERTLGDLPWADYRVVMQFEVRKFFCDNASCQRRIFSERLHEIAAPWARRTQRLNAQLSEIGLVLGGAAGIRLSQKLHCTVSRNTILRLVMRLPPLQVAAPRIVGIDDFAFRKCVSYGTIIVNLETHKPISLLPRRAAEPVTEWLSQYPGIEIVSRDRSSAYRSGITAGAPSATQVADRFHLMQNLAEVLEQVLRTQTQVLRTVGETESKQVSSETIAVIAQILSDLVPKSDQVSETDSQLQEEQLIGSAHWQKRSTQHQTIWSLFEQGWATAAIAQEVGLGVRTVQRDLRKPQFADPQRRSDYGDSLAVPYRAFITEYLQKHKQTYGLFSVLKRQGYKGSRRTLSRYVHRLREAGSLTSQSHRPRSPAPKRKTESTVPATPLSANRATWLVMCVPKKRTREQKQLIKRLKTHSPVLKTVIELSEAFCKLIRHRQSEQFETWLKEVEVSDLIPFQKFAQGLQQDYEAVKAAMTLPISNGPVEGQINRLKLLKRQMYGRAGIKLLEQRFLLIS